MAKKTNSQQVEDIGVKCLTMVKLLRGYEAFFAEQSEQFKAKEKEIYAERRMLESELSQFETKSAE